MGMYCVGEVIKKTREGLGITQEELCDGICSVETLSRIENGKRSPNRTNFQLLMERMGKCGEKYFPFIRSDDVSIMQEHEKVNRMLQKRQFEDVDFLLTYLEAKLDLTDNVNRQFILRSRSMNDYCLGRINEKEKRIMLMEALLCTIPSFDANNISKGIFTHYEITIICNIATSYAEEGNFDIAIKFLTQIENYFANVSIDIEERATSESFMLAILSQTLGRNKNIEDALKVGNKGMELCLEAKLGGNLATFLFNTAFDMVLLNEDGKACKIRLLQAFYVARLNDNWRQMEFIKNYWEKIYGTFVLI